MKGDFSRITFDPAKHYGGVLHQQGRVWLDSDWNEDVLERLAAAQREIRDIVGFCGVPSPGSAFVLSASTSPCSPRTSRNPARSGRWCRPAWSTRPSPICCPISRPAIS